MARLRSEFRVYAVRNRLKAELQTLLATNRIGMGCSMPIRLLDNLPGKRGCEVFAFKIEVMLSGVPSRAKAETERSRSIPCEHRRRPNVRVTFHGILRLRAAPPPPSRRLLRMTFDFVRHGLRPLAALRFALGKMSLRAFTSPSPAPAAAPRAATAPSSPDRTPTRAPPASLPCAMRGSPRDRAPHSA